MKKSTRTLLGASLALGVGAALLLGGVGTLAYWNDSSISQAQQIQSGTLALGTIGTSSLSASLIQRVPGFTETPPVAYGTQALVPGDVLRVTVNVPVSITGQNMKAQLTVTPAKAAVSTSASADVNLNAALGIAVVSVNGVATPTVPLLTPADVAGGVVPVVIEVSFPWGSASQYNDTVGGMVKLDAAFALIQVPAGQLS